MELPIYFNFGVYKYFCDCDFLLQLWLRCCLTSGLLFCGRAGTFWVGVSGTMFRISLGGWLCRLQLLWGEFRFFFFLGLFLRFWLFAGLTLLIIWCLGSLLISAIFIVYEWFSVLKGFLLLFVLSKEAMFCAYAVLFK
jgi:hypothetical protein